MNGSNAKYWSKYTQLFLKFLIFLSIVLFFVFPYETYELCGSSSSLWSMPDDTSAYTYALLVYWAISFTATAIGRDGVITLLDVVVLVAYCCYVAFTAFVFSFFGGIINYFLLNLQRKVENYVHGTACHEQMTVSFGIGFYAFWAAGALLVALVMCRFFSGREA